MNNGKLDNTLSLALDVPESVRDETSDLNVGFSAAARTWELIIRYNSDVDSIIEALGGTIVKLSGGYGIVTIGEDKVNGLSDYNEIEFIEKPKRLEFAVSEGIAISCIEPVTRGNQGLSGRGVLIGIIDSGIDYSHPDFRNSDGTSRIVALWDQSVASGAPPEGFVMGTLYTEETINQALAAPAQTQQMELVPSTDLSGHGTHVAGICCGNGRGSNGRNTGVAPQSDIAVVKLGSSIGESFPKTTNLMMALEFLIRLALGRKQPIAINISFGNNYGSHSSRSLLETYINEMAGIWKSAICIGTGNDGATGHHNSGAVEEGLPLSIELAVANYEKTLNLQIWKNYYDLFDIELISPSGRSVGVLTPVIGTNRFVIDSTEILFFYGEPVPYNDLQEIYLEFIPQNQYIPSGIWNIRLVPNRIITGEYDMWIPSGSSLNPMTRFLRPTEETTLTIPSTAFRTIGVGAYDGRTDSYAYFSGRGYTRNNQWVKPDIVAPGVNITSAAPGGGYTSRTGTSMATPFVTGAAALMMEWGIVNGNDGFLYGEKVKAYLRRGARPLPGFSVYPNPQVGYGALCVRDSLPG